MRGNGRDQKLRAERPRRVVEAAQTGYGADRLHADEVGGREHNIAP